ncbi:MAG: hypothetical protein ACK4GM_08770 [Tabrizicola sp.]
MSLEQNGLRFAAGVTMATGLGLALAAIPMLSPPLRFLVDLVVWPLDGAETLLASETRLILAIAGGLMVGWGMTIRGLAGAPLARDPQSIRAIIRNSILAWFVVDCAGSIAAGAALNLLPNLGFLALFLVPMRGAGRPATT